LKYFPPPPLPTYEIPLNFQHLFWMNQLQNQHDVKQEFYLKEEAEEINIKYEF